MPAVYSKIDISDVKEILRRRGYGFNSTWRFPVQLNKPSATRHRADGRPYMDQLRGIQKGDLDAILMRAPSADEAATIIERMSIGETISGVEEAETKFGPKAGASIDTEALERLVKNRVDMAFAEVESRLRGELALISDRLESLCTHVQGEPAADASKRKPGRPKGSKNKPKLTEEQVQEKLDEMGLGSVKRPDGDG